MIRKFVALFFLCVFIGYASLPSFLLVFNTDVDIALYIDMNEEENKEGESSKEKDIKVIDFYNLNNSQFDTTLTVYNTLCIKRYSSVYLNHISPPPELI